MTTQQIFEIEYRWRVKSQDTYDIAHWMNVYGARNENHIPITEADVENALFKYVFKHKRRERAA